MLLFLAPTSKKKRELGMTKGTWNDSLQLIGVFLAAMWRTYCPVMHKRKIIIYICTITYPVI